MSVAIVVAEYMGAGYRCIPIPARSKAPTTKGWQFLRLGEKDLPRFTGNVGVLVGEPSGWLVDVDLDCAEALELAPQFLPPSLTFGRKSTLRSHWLFIARGAKTEKFHGDGETLVELRSTGGQTVFPGSIHPSGELVQWSDGFDPEQVATLPAAELRDRVARLAVAALLVRTGVDQEDAVASARGELYQLQQLAPAWFVPPSAPQPAARRNVGPAGEDLRGAVARYNSDHRGEWPRNGGNCPGCGHRGCFGTMPGNPSRWACFSAGHAGVGVQGPTCWHGDALDLDAHAAGVGRVEQLKRTGYYEPRGVA